MNRWGKVLLAALPLALLLTAACRFIYHTDRDYSQWMAIYGKSTTRLAAHCAERNMPGACSAARDSRLFTDALTTHHAKVMAWWWPTFVSMLIAWLTAIVSMLPLAWSLLRRIPDRKPDRSGPAW